jgi:DNA-binding transcriptional ArsR family regulator
MNSEKKDPGFSGNGTASLLHIDVLLLKKSAGILRAVNHKLRQQVLFLLHREGQLGVTDIYQKLRLDQSVTSQHLAVLRQAGFVLTERRGKQIFYSVNYKRLEELEEFNTRILG